METILLKNRTHKVVKIIILNCLLIMFQVIYAACPIHEPNFTTSVSGNTVTISLSGSGYNSYLCGYGDVTYGTQLTHSYTTAGTKTVCVNFRFTDSLNTAHNCDTTICKTITITNTTPFTCPIREANFSTSVSGNIVTLAKTGSGYNSYSWTYGDGTTGTSSTHTYTGSGIRTICLRLQYVDSTNTAHHCDTTICRTITLTPDTCPIHEPNFTTSVNGNTVTIALSGSGYNSYLYNYGDGTTGTSNTHTYITPGTRTICINYRYTENSNTTHSCDTTVCRTINIESNIFTCPIREVYFSVQINGNTVMLAKYGSGYTSYQWNYGDGGIGTNNTHTYTSTGTKTICLKYSYEGLDSNNVMHHCDTTFCKTITISPTFSCHLENVNFTTNVRGDTVYLTKSGSGYTSYMWSYGDGHYGRDNYHVYSSNGTKNVCIKFIDSTNTGSCDTIVCRSIDINDACDSISCVLPGDADHDFTVNNFDIFAIGLSYNRVGLTRPNATTQYTLQRAPNWVTNSYYVFNDKFVDCNGNGVINNADASVILQNYIAKPYNYFNHRIGNLDSLPSVSLAFDSIPVFQIGNPCNTTEIVSDINVGSANQMASNVYGIGFSVNYPTNFATDSCFRIQVDLDADSWFANNEPVLYLVKNLPQFNRVDIGIVRTTGIPRSGNGRIGKIKFVVEDGIFINGRVSNDKHYSFTVDHVAGVDNTGNNISFVGLSSDVAFVVSAIKQNKVEGLKIYPNPTNDKIYINAKERIESVKIMDLSGRIVNEFSPNANDIQFDISNAENGMYILEIKGKSSVSYEKIFKQ